MDLQAIRHEAHTLSKGTHQLLECELRDGLIVCVWKDKEGTQLRMEFEPAGLPELIRTLREKWAEQTIPQHSDARHVYDQGYDAGRADERGRRLVEQSEKPLIAQSPKKGGSDNLAKARAAKAAKKAEAEASAKAAAAQAPTEPPPAPESHVEREDEQSEVEA